MKKSTRIVKKLLALFLVVLISIDSFAAAVSDNDGSAFITKAEFDSLKTNFQSQIDKYNTSIDAKIDNAIASYLSGITSKHEEIVSIPFASWEKVTNLGYALGNEFWYPNVNLCNVMLGGMRYSTEQPLETPGNDRYGYENYWGNLKISYKRPSTITSKRLLCVAGTEGTTYPTYVTWDGVATNFLDEINSTIVFNVNDENWTNQIDPSKKGDDTGYLWGSRANGMSVAYATRLGTGYFQRMDQVGWDIWHPRWFWGSTIYDGNDFDIGTFNNQAGYRSVDSTLAASNDISMSLMPVNNETRIYQHIINYNNYNYDYLTDIHWNHTLRYVTDGTLTRESFLQVVSKDAKWANLEWWNPDHKFSDLDNINNEVRFRTVTNVKRIVSGDMWAGNTNLSGDKTDTTPVVTAGIVNKRYDSKHIFQSGTLFRQIVDGSVFESGQLNLCSGFPIFAANKGDTIEWSPKFIDTYSNGVASDFELNISLSTEPFGEGNTVSSNNKLIIFDGQTTATPLTTTNKTCKMKFTMPQSGIIYMKWWPADTNIQSSNWEASLDIKNCDTYIEYSS